MRRSGLEGIASLQIFADLPAATIGRLQQETTIRIFPAKTVLLHEGDEPKALYIVIDGLVQLFTGQGVQEATVLMLRAPSFFPVETILNNDVALVSVRAIKTSRIACINADAARQMFHKDQKFAELITSNLATSCQSLFRELKNMRSRNAFQRLVAWILAMQANADTPTEFVLPFEKSVLAARLGMAPATLSRDFAKLAGMGVTIRGRTLRISDPDMLRQFAADDAISAPSLP